MKRTTFLLMLVCILYSCNNGKWWGERKIARIDGNDGISEIFSYGKDGKLIHYFQGTGDILQGDKIYYDVSIEYTDTVAIIKGMMPYETYEHSGYMEGVSTYKLNDKGLATSCITIYPNDTLLDKGYKHYSNFRYNNNQLTYASRGSEAKEINYEKNNIAYKNYDSSPSGITFVTTFINYSNRDNKSCLITPIEEYIGWHIPAFYARLMGRPCKNMISEHAVDHGGGQLVYNYSYDFDTEGYVTDITESRSSNINLFGSDLLSRTVIKTVTYVD